MGLVLEGPEFSVRDERERASYIASLELNDQNPYAQYVLSLSQMGSVPPPSYEC